MRTCTNCGFLALERVSNQELEVATRHFRQTYSAIQPYEREPVCYVEAINLRARSREYAKALSNEETEEFDHKTLVASVSEVVQESRDDCPSWTRWRDELSLADHRQLLDAQEERDRDRNREDKKWTTEVWGLGLGLLIVTFLGPIVAVVLDNCVLD